MADTTQQRTQRLFPFLYVDDVRGYLEFLTKAFGFETRSHHVDSEDPEHQHAEASLGGEVVMIGHASPKWKTMSPRELTAATTGIYAYVDEVDVHCRRARAAGAAIEAEPEDKHWGDRQYTARDPEGYQWYFATRQRGA